MALVFLMQCQEPPNRAQGWTPDFFLCSLPTSWSFSPFFSVDPGISKGHEHLLCHRYILCPCPGCAIPCRGLWLATAYNWHLLHSGKLPFTNHVFFRLCSQTTHHKHRCDTLRTFLNIHQMLRLSLMWHFLTWRSEFDQHLCWKLRIFSTLTRCQVALPSPHNLFRHWMSNMGKVSLLVAVLLAVSSAADQLQQNDVALQSLWETIQALEVQLLGTLEEELLHVAWRIFDFFYIFFVCFHRTWSVTKMRQFSWNFSSNSWQTNTFKKLLNSSRQQLSNSIK